MKSKALLIVTLVSSIALSTPASLQQDAEAAVFRVTINGFTCNRPTPDDSLQRDGVDDEVFLYADTYELTATRDAFAQPLGFYLNVRTVQSSVLGDTNNHSNRIQAGSGHNIFGGNGGFRAGDSLPAQTPWVQSSVLLMRRDVQLNRMPPMTIWEGYLARGRSAVLIVPTIWEADDQRTPDLDPFLAPGGSWNRASQSVLSQTTTIAKLAADPKADYGFVINTIRDAFNREVVIPGRLANEPTERPIGMKDLGDRYGFTPEAFVLNYDVAEQLSQSRFNGVPGIAVISYRDDGPLNGDYTVYLQIQRR